MDPFKKKKKAKTLQKILPESFVVKTQSERKNFCSF